jgi:hypothetical protein
MSENMFNENTELDQNISKRVRCDYDLLQQDIMKLRKQNVLNELEILKLTGKSIIFENQDLIAYEVVSAFKNRKIINIMVVSKTQSGKTGSMCATIKKYLEDTSNLIPIENIYIITGLSSCEWKEQTKERMPESIQSRVFHRCELPNTFVDEIKYKKNILVIMDEIQVAAKKGQTIFKTFKNAGLLNKLKLYEHDIKILEYTATPDGTIYDLMKWNDASYKILADVGDGYISSYNLYSFGRFLHNESILIEIEKNNISGKIIKTYDNDQYDVEYTLNNEKKIKKCKQQEIIPNDISEKRMNILKLNKRIKQYKELCGYDKESGEVDKEVFKNIEEIKNDIDKYINPLYHIIRTKNGVEQDLTIQNFKKIFCIDNYEFIKYDRESEIEDINKTLIINPKKHTFIFIKEMLRCAKTLKKKYIGILYDRYSKNPDDTTIIQGLAGRDTGYDNNGISICYTNINSIERYEELWKSKFEDKTIKWNSKTTKYTNGILSGKDTFNDPRDYDGFSVTSDDTNEISEPVIKKFKTQEEAKEYYNKELKEKMKGRGPNKIKPNDDGYYEAVIRSNRKIYNCDEIKDERKYGLNENNYRFYPCYENVNDKSTLQWWFIHY